MKQAAWRASPSQWVNVPHFVLAGLLVVVSGPISNIAEALIQNASEFGVDISSAWATGLWFGFLMLGLLYGLWHYFVIRCTSYSLIEDQLQEQHGVLNKTFDSLELYRIKDVRVISPLMLRLFGLGHVWVDSSDRTTPGTRLMAVKNAGEIGRLILVQTEKRRVQKGVREFD